MRWLVYEIRAWWWRKNPRRGARCGDLACICDECTEPECPCGGAPWGFPD